MPSGSSDSPAETELIRAEGLLVAREVGRALATYDVAEQMGADPDRCAAGRWEARMLQGDMEGAWRESDAIRARESADPHRFWDRLSLRGRTVIVRCLHGYGDTVQMFRYLPNLLATATRVILEVPPRLLPLMASLSLSRETRLEVVTWPNDEEQRAARWETQIEVTELPYVFRTGTTDLPIAVNYLGLPEYEVKRAADAMGRASCLRVGLVWTAGKWNLDRALDPAFLRPLLECPAEFWSLVQRSDYLQVDDAEMQGRLKDAEIVGEGILPMAAVIANLDLVITTDTLAAHLAGAIGTRVWVLLPHAADWRWMSDVERSCWYPSMRLFRQASPGDWAPVLQHVRSALEVEVMR